MNKHTTAREKSRSREDSTPSPEDLFRVEVIANRSIQEDFFERLKESRLDTHYTLFPEVQGSGNHGLRRGDHIWPEENFVYVAYITKSEARTVQAHVTELVTRFPDEGIRFFVTRGVSLA